MYDILATTSNEKFVNKSFKDEYVSFSDGDKPKKTIITDGVLFEADTFSFGTKIGAITNKGSSCFALLEHFEQDSEERNKIMERLRTLPVIQNKEIDKTKTGQKTKGIPSTWVTYEKEKDFENSLLVDRHPYFFIHLYDKTKRAYQKYKSTFDKKSKQMFGVSVEELLKFNDFDNEMIEFLDLYYHKNPTIDSNSVMNKICKRIERLNSKVNFNKNVGSNALVFDILFNTDVDWDWGVYKKVVTAFNKCKKEKSKKNNRGEFEDFEILNDSVRLHLLSICSNEMELLNYLIYHIYKDKDLESGKEMVWMEFGDLIFKIVKSNSLDYFEFPIVDSCGDVNYLDKSYTKREVFYE